MTLERPNANTNAHAACHHLSICVMILPTPSVIRDPLGELGETVVEYKLEYFGLFERGFGP